MAIRLVTQFYWAFRFVYFLYQATLKAKKEKQEIQKRSDDLYTESEKAKIIMNDNNENIKIEQDYVCDLIDEQLNFGNSTIIRLTNEYKTKTAIIDSYQKGDITSEPAICVASKLKKNMH